METCFRTALLLLGLSILACESSKVKEPETEQDATTVAVRTATLSKGDYLEYGTFLGTLQAQEEITLIAHAGGRVDKINAKSGDSVKKGQRLCDIDGERLQVLAESAALSERIARSKYERLKSHLSRGSSSPLQVDQAKLEYLSAKRNRLETGKQRDGGFCISPIAGVVISKVAERFQELRPGEPTLVIADLTQLRFVTGIPENEIAGYQLGSEAIVTIPGVEDRTWTGTVASIDLKVGERDRTFAVEISIDNDDGFLKPGQTGNVRILRHAWKNQIVIPRDAVVTQGKDLVVMVVEGDRAKRQPVSIKSSSQSDVVIGQGLEPGQQIIVSGQHQATDGSFLKIIEAH